MADETYEVTVVTKNSKNETAEVHAEYTTSATNPHNAAREVVDAVIKQTSNSRMREIDPSV